MKQIEYFYNVIYYFFYRATIRFALFVTTPIFYIYGYIYKIPVIKKRFEKKGINDPLEWHKQKYQKGFLENTKVSAGTIIGAGLAQTNLLLFYMGIYYIIKHFLFSTFEVPDNYDIIAVAILAFSTDVVFSQINNKGEKYIKEFNKKKGWWRIKWKIITILSPFISLAFCLYSAFYIDV